MLYTNLKKTALYLCIPASMMIGLVGCEYTDVTIDSVDTAYTFEAVVFDTFMYYGEASEAMRYSWDFGDGSSATGDNPSHVYGQAGTYTVTLTTTDTYTKEIKTTQKEVVITPLASTKSNQVAVTVFNGVDSNQSVIVKNATVTINGTAVTTDDKGMALFDAVDADNTTLVQVQADGYHSQSIQLDPNYSADSRSLSITLTDAGITQPVTDISVANSVSYYPQSSYNNITVSFDDNSFVTKDGELATGMTEVNIKPWNPINTFDMLGFLGDAVAIDNTGAYTQLVSYGAMTVEFTQDGEKLQLAPGKYATISMPLYLDSHYDGRPIVVGDTIPMWSFAENTGAWIQEGDLMGEVITDDMGNLLLEAKVSHFTTWNWDMKFDNPSSMFIQCQLPNSTPVPCNVQASFNHPNNGVAVTKQTAIPVEGKTVVNIDPSVSVELYGAYYDSETEILYNTIQPVLNASNTILTLYPFSVEPIDIDPYPIELPIEPI